MDNILRLVASNRWAQLFILLCGFITLAAAHASDAFAGDGLAGLQADLHHQLALGGGADGGYVYDLTEKKVLFSERANVMRPPASVEKLYTATTALDLMGPDARLTTSVYGVGHLEAGGVWNGSLYLKGGGDPTFGSAAFIREHYEGIGTSMSVLAEQLIKYGIRRVTGSVDGDESYFDSLRGEPSSDYAYDPYLEGVLSGLAYNRGESGTEKGPHAPAAYAARKLRAVLRTDHVLVPHGGGAATTPAGATLLAHAESPTIQQLLGLMLPPSDNFFAEMLVKDIGVRYGGAGTTAAGAKIVASTIAKLLNIHPAVVDGSGLSESDKTSPYQVADLLVELEPTAIGTVLRDSLAVAGRTGTLSERMRNSGAAGRCEGKTGTLTGVSNLVGYCTAANGHLIAFAFFNDRIATSTAHTIQDHMTITIADSDITAAELGGTQATGFASVRGSGMPAVTAAADGDFAPVSPGLLQAQLLGGLSSLSFSW